MKMRICRTRNAEGMRNWKFLAHKKEEQRTQNNHRNQQKNSMNVNL